MHSHTRVKNFNSWNSYLHNALKYDDQKQSFGDVLEIFGKFSGEHLRWSLFFSKNTFYAEHLRTANIGFIGLKITKE